MRIRELNESLDIVTVNKRLNPKIWEGGELKPEVREKLLDIARVFKEFIGVDIKVIDITVTGSNANYTWTEYSDLDLHLIVPGTPTEAERELYTAKKALWAEQHNITIKGLPVECYVQGDAETHHSTGVYSIAKEQWIIEPKKVKPKVDDAAVQAKKDSLVHDIETALLSKDIEKLRAVKERITKMRKAGLERAGEWSTENLVFKVLRNLGHIDSISDKIRELEDQELSLEQQDNILD
jgi:predicted nucleotidyltransferase